MFVFSRFTNVLIFSTLSLTSLGVQVQAASIQETVSCAEFDQKASCATEVVTPPRPQSALMRDFEKSGIFDRYFRTDVAGAPSEEQKQEMVAKVYSKMEQYSSQYFCNAGIRVSRMGRMYDQYNLDLEMQNKGIALSDLNRKMISNQYLTENASRLLTQKDALLEKIKSITDTINFCADKPSSMMARQVAIIHPPCELALTNFLPDNEYKLNKQLPKIRQSTQFQEVEKCLNGKADLLSKVTILASSDQLNNTSSEFCKKDFIGLSKARAENARDVLLPALLSGAEKNVEVVLDYEGKNKNGSSGPCPYQWVNQDGKLKEKMIEGFKENPEMKKNLEKGKYLMVRFEFKDKETAAIRDDIQLNQILPCGSIRVSCD